MDISAEQFDENFKGYIVVDCAIRSKDIFYFSLCEDYTQFPDWDGGEGPPDGSLQRRIVYFARKFLPDKRWGYVELKGVRNLNGGIVRTPVEQIISVDANGTVFAFGSGISELETSLTSWRDGGIKRGGIIRCRPIDGNLYVAGGGRSVGYRTARNTWISLTQGLPFTYEKDWEKAGFEDIDGFSANDIYAVGGKGDVWHFDGSIWTQIRFPTNIDLYTVCCAGDGEVYISGYGGTTFKGRGQRWKQACKGEMSIPFRKTVWHDNELWCTSDYGVWKIKGKKLEAADVDVGIKVCSGHLSTYDGILLLAGHSGAAYLENGTWHKIF